MADFDIDNPVFSSSLRKLETTDKSHADTFNELFKVLIQNDIALKTQLGDPESPTAPTPEAGDSSTRVATTAFVEAALASLIGAAPEQLDTLDELAQALGSDPNFSATVMELLGQKAVKSTAVTAVLINTKWTGSAAPFTQTVNVTGVTADNNILVGLASTASADQYNAACKAKLLPGAQGAGTVTVKAYGTKPAIDLPVQVVILG